MSAGIRTLADAAGAPLLTGAAVTRVFGHLALRRVEVTDAGGRVRAFDCDLLAMSGGWSPTVHLTSHHGGRPVWNEDRSLFLPPEQLPPGLAVAGAANGDLSLDLCLAAGARAGAEAAERSGFQTSVPATPSVDPESTALVPLWRVKNGRGKAFVDFQNDVGASDVALAHREGFRAVEHLKRYTTLGMATDQGKTSNVNGLALMADASERSIAETGTTTFRPPFTPVAIGALAGHHRGRDFKPIRRTATQDWATEQGAVFVEAGLWLRAQYFPRPGEKDWLETVTREARTVREAAGICDVSTLGKIDLQGPDAATLLDRIYCNAMASLPVGRVRYGLMLREDGLVMDDGTAARLGPDHFIVTTTTANAVKVFQHFEFCPAMAVAGARRADVLRHRSVGAALGRRAAVARGARAYRRRAVRSVQRRLPAYALRRVDGLRRHASAAVPPVVLGRTRLRDRGPGPHRRRPDPAIDGRSASPWGSAPMARKRSGVLRVEKGHPAGNELSGQTTAADLGLGRMVSQKKDYIGAAMTGRPGLVDPDRPVLVGLRPVDRNARLRGGAHLVRQGAAGVAADDEGYVTSVVYSPAMGQWIGLGLLARGTSRLGETIRAYDPLRKEDVEVEVVAPVFVDPEGARLHG